MINALCVNRSVGPEAIVQVTGAFGVWRSENVEQGRLAFDTRVARSLRERPRRSSGWIEPLIDGEVVPALEIASGASIHSHSGTRDGDGISMMIPLHADAAEGGAS